MIFSTDEQWMRLALREAWKGRGSTSPNPMVGAVIVAHGELLSRGYHTAAGQPHAEIEALCNLPSLKQARGATLYVTLEPCSTRGKTLPCTKAIIEAGLSRVVYGTNDPNPAHQGAAQKILEQAGIQITSGILEKKCSALNHAWNHRMTTNLPWVIAKCGMSLDGRISSPPGQRWITSEASRHHAMLLRSHVDAILVGGGTVRSDNPALTLRGIQKNNKNSLQPWRIIWTQSGSIPPESQVLIDAHRDRTIILQNFSLQEALQNLAARGISSVLIEGGGKTLGVAFEENLVDEVQFYIAPVILGTGTSAVNSQDSIPPVQLFKIRRRQLGPDFLISGLVEK